MKHNNNIITYLLFTSLYSVYVASFLTSVPPLLNNNRANINIRTGIETVSKGKNKVEKQLITSSSYPHEQKRSSIRSPTELNVALTGKISSILTKLSNAPSKNKEVLSALQHNMNTLDIIPICMLGWIMKPVSKYIYNKVFPTFLKRSRDYKQTILYFVTNILSSIGRIALIVYLFDILDVILTVIGFEIAAKYEFSTIVAKVCYTVFAALQMKEYKNALLQKEKRKNSRYPITLINRSLNLLLYIVSGLILVDTLHIDMGVTLSSLFAFSGVGTIVLSLASQNIATGLMNGLEISVSQNFVVGDEIRMSDGTQGIVAKLGILGMDIEGDDDLTMEIPYSDVREQKIINLSNASKSQVKQTLRFQYKDMYRLKSILDEIKIELKTSCSSTLITDGTSSFTVVMTDYKEDHISVIVDTHHYVRPSCAEYDTMRQGVLEAIARVMERNNMNFALPSVVNIAGAD